MFVVEKIPESMEAEAYRILRTNLEYSSVNKVIKSILITSSQFKEGKSTVASNIALIFAQENKRVILLDCDLKKPSLHKMFNISNVEGISELLIGKLPIEECIKTYNECLDILTAGRTPTNSSQMLGSQSMDMLLEYLSDRYDIIILDSAPIGVITDAQILSTKVDGTILVVKAEETRMEFVMEAKNRLNKVGANILGALLNEARIKTTKYPGYSS